MDGEQQNLLSAQEQLEPLSLVGRAKDTIVRRENFGIAEDPEMVKRYEEETKAKYAECVKMMNNKLAVEIMGLLVANNMPTESNEFVEKIHGMCIGQLDAMVG